MCLLRPRLRLTELIFNPRSPRTSEATSSIITGLEYMRHSPRCPMRRSMCLKSRNLVPLCHCWQPYINGNKHTKNGNLPRVNFWAKKTPLFPVNSGNKESLANPEIINRITLLAQRLHLSRRICRHFISLLAIEKQVKYLRK